MKKMRGIAKQKGFLLVVAVVLIVVVGFIGIALSYMIYESAYSTLNLQQSTSALFIAESGFEHATHKLLTSTLSNRSNCAGLSLSNASIGDGAYTVTGTGPSYVSAPTTLNGALTANATTITLTSTANYQSSGRIMIDHELINYSNTDATHFLNVQRGVDSSTPASHTSGTSVGQYQCNLNSQGGAPSLTPPSITDGGKRNLSEAIQLQEGWIAGNNLSASVWNVAHWNTPTEKQWTQQTISISAAQILTSVSIVSNVDAWIVGNKGSALHYNGSTWSQINTGITAGDNLTSVSAVSSQEVWACADQGKIYKWTPSTNWTSPSNPGNNPNDISMVDTNGDGVANAGWLVGAKKTAYQYNGTNWASANSGITADLNGVSTLSATDAWAAANGGNIFHWTGGASWTSVSTPTTNTLNSISMINTGSLDIGWAVGNTSTALFYNGTSWALSNTGLASALTLKAVVTVSSSEAWLVDSSGHVYEWNGSTWTLVFTSGAALGGIDMIHSNHQPFSAWSENFS